MQFNQKAHMQNDSRKTKSNFVAVIKNKIIKSMGLKRRTYKNLSPLVFRRSVASPRLSSVFLNLSQSDPRLSMVNFIPSTEPRTTRGPHSRWCQWLPIITTSTLGPAPP